ncbi:hypothetical protein GCM10009636_32490 [Arthrobacter koreensis]|uniref:hypothetical protein n=1 Tax=Arthrobacter koreensis TaxID=199136 RepID=UPI0012650E86|nr:hypothetical protein [Arthrobacter koreensis]
MAAEAALRKKKAPSVGTMISVGSAILAFLKIYSFAHWDTYTVSTILTHQSFSGLFAITLVVLLPAALVVAFWMLATSLGESIREEEPWRSAAVTCVLLGLGCVLLAPWKWAAFVFVFGGFQVAYAMLVRALRSYLLRAGKKVPWLIRKTRLPHQSNTRFLAIAFMVVGLLVIALSDWGWSPKERLEIQGGERVGYFVAEQADYIVWIGDDDRRVEFIPASRLLGRTPCFSSERSLLAELVGPELRSTSCE